MKKSIRIAIPILLALAILVCTGWYLFIYDREFTRDMLLYAARGFEKSGNHQVAAWFYDSAYKQANDNDAVAIELAEQYRAAGNYTKAEYTLTNAIKDNASVQLYIALSKTFVEQDKLMDAVKMLDSVQNASIKRELNKLRPDAPTSSPDPLSSNAYYTQYITVNISVNDGTLYVSTNGEFPSVQKDKYTGGITLKDGENTIHAIAVADNGLVSRSSIFGFTVGGVIEKVTFQDAAVEAAMREILGVPADKTLYTDNLWTIKEFTVPEGAQNLSDLRHLAFVEKITITNGVTGQLSNLAGLANVKDLEIKDTTVNAEELPVIGKLPNLQKLILNNCGLSTLSGLETAKELTHLDLQGNTLRNITPLSDMKKLQELNLSHNALNDLTPLTGITTLVSLDVAYNNLSTLSPITGISGLNKLTANNNVLTEITGFNQLTALQELYLNNNTISDISALSSCNNIIKLNVSDNALSDISALSKLNKLEDLKFSNNKVKKLPQWSADCALVNIDGSYNQLDTMAPLGGLKKLNNVYMDYNKEISSVKTLASCPVLIQVNVYGTKVTQVRSLTSQNIIVNYDPTQ